MVLNSVKFLGGGERAMVTIARHLHSRGHHPVVVARRDSPVLNEAARLGLPHEPLWIAGDLNPILLWKLARLVRKYRIQFVLANLARDIRISGLVKRAIGGFSVIGLHQVDRPFGTRWNYKFTYNHLADAIVVNSNATLETIRSGSPWYDSSRLHVIPHGIDPASYATGDGCAVRESLGIGPDAFVLGFVGRLSRQKGIAPMLAAMEMLSTRHPELHLIIAGAGSMEKKVRHHADLHANVHFLGFRSDVPSVMKACDVMLVPSLWEGFGLVVVECMAAGIPCIASNISSIPELIESEVSGILIPPDDSAALAAAVERLVTDPQLRERVTAGAADAVHRKFTTDRMIQNYEVLFSKMSGCRPGARVLDQG